MSLTLHVISHQRPALGDQAKFVFNPGPSGTANIGRLDDNEWSLPDPQRLISGHHARIHVREGRYFIEDTSTNGIFADRGARQIPRSTLHPLRDGEVLQLGDYHLRVRIDEVFLPQQLHDWAEQLQQLSGTGNFPVSQLAMLNFLPGDEELTPALMLDDMLDRGAGLGANQTQPQATDPPLEPRTALQDFCTGAGLDIDQLPPAADNRLMMLAGQMLREALLGMTQLQRLQQQAASSGSYRSLPATPADPQSAAIELVVTEKLLTLLNGHERSELDAVRRVRDAFASLRTHQQALQARSNALI